MAYAFIYVHEIEGERGGVEVGKLEDLYGTTRELNICCEADEAPPFHSD